MSSTYSARARRPYKQSGTRATNRRKLPPSSSTSRLLPFFTRHNNLRFILVWTPWDEELAEQEMACNCAADACRQDPPNGLARINSAAFQKDLA